MGGLDYRAGPCSSTRISLWRPGFLSFLPQAGFDVTVP
jgi:hypothetical protein